MENRTAYIFVFDGFADWEPASALAELRRTFRFSVRTVAFARNLVSSMGGLQVLPDCSMGEVRPDCVDILVLPGGDKWMRGEIQEVTSLIKSVHSAGRPIAAICAATLSLAHAGLLENHRHTSNGRTFIANFVPGYKGHHLYDNARAVRDGNIITANGLAPFAFASEIFRAVAPDREHDIATYEGLYSRALFED